jgi:hypothetical protein
MKQPGKFVVVETEVVERKRYFIRADKDTPVEQLQTCVPPNSESRTVQTVVAKEVAYSELIDLITKECPEFGDLEAALLIRLFVDDRREV